MGTPMDGTNHSVEGCPRAGTGEVKKSSWDKVRAASGGSARAPRRRNTGVCWAASGRTAAAAGAAAARPIHARALQRGRDGTRRLPTAAVARGRGASHGGRWLAAHATPPAATCPPPTPPPPPYAAPPSLSPRRRGRPARPQQPAATDKRAGPGAARRGGGAAAPPPACPSPTARRARRRPLQGTTAAPLGRRQPHGARSFFSRCHAPRHRRGGGRHAAPPRGRRVT